VHPELERKKSWGSKNRGGQREINSQQRSYEASYRWLYMRYKPKDYYFEFVVMLRKQALVAASVFFFDNIGVLMILSTLIISVALACQLKHSPFLPTVFEDPKLLDTHCLTKGDKLELLSSFCTFMNPVIGVVSLQTKPTGCDTNKMQLCKRSACLDVALTVGSVLCVLMLLIRASWPSRRQKISSLTQFGGSNSTWRPSSST